jgi:Rieske Fe-S protein
MSTISRRRALGAATAGVGLPVLAACGGDDGTTSGTDPSPEPTSRGAESPPSTTATTRPRKTTAEPPPEGIPTSDVPVGGGLVVKDEEIVITQPSEGDFRAFTAVCTHQGCLVARVSEEIECDCHSSRYSIADGSVTGGPAPSPLAPADIAVSRGRISVG